MSLMLADVSAYIILDKSFILTTSYRETYYFYKSGGTNDRTNKFPFY